MPLIYGHRGASGYAPENTLEAFELAAKQKADGVELDVQLSFKGEINSALVATILDKIIVKKESTKEEIHLDIYLKLGQKFEAVYAPQATLTGINPQRSTTPRRRTRRI